MPNKGVRRGLLAALLVCLAGCGSGAEKQAFSRYEKQMDPILTKDAALEQEFGERVKDLNAFGNEGDFDDLVRDRMVPFYAKMQKQVEAVAPKGKRLAAIHAELARYVTLERQFLADYLRFHSIREEADRAGAPARLAVEAARAKIEKKMDALREASMDAPDDVKGKIVALFQQETKVWSNLDSTLTALKKGEASSARFRVQLARGYRPFYDHAKKTVDGMEPGPKGKAIVDAARSYLDAVEKVLDAAGKMAEARAPIEEKLGPVRDRMNRLLKAARSAYRDYKTDASDYREKLR